MGGTVPDLVEALLACADTTRLRILHLLLNQHDLCVYDLADVIGASQPKISRHLAYLRRSGLVSFRKDGLWVYYRISSDSSAPITLLIESLALIFRQTGDLNADLYTLDEVQARRSSLERRYTSLEQKLPSQPATQMQSRPEQTADATPDYIDEDEDLEIELL